ncbi:hypothetical protein [Mesoplasma lactucae]|uniref:hypothetical protein n=1 Tax=Mesoplasma lactucae TaxID=138853 RepID=UPI002022B40B|nr:hypothetical protein [Mesoplasma lactucae]MCL8216998.1 Chromosome partition protein Smc [Mesoplasma lactucae ATCC 49193]
MDNQLKAAASEILKLNKEIDDLTTLTGQLIIKNQEQANLIKQQEAEIEANKAKIKELEQQAILDKGTIESLGQELETAQNNLKEAIKTIGEKDEEISGLNTKIAEKDKEIFDQKTTIDNLEKQVGKLTKDLAKAKETQDTLSKEISSLTADNLAKDKEITDLKRTNADLDARLTDALNKIKGLENQATIDRDTIEDLRHQKDALQEEGIKATEEIDRLTSEVNDLKNKVSDLEEQVGQKFDNINDLIIYRGQTDTPKIKIKGYSKELDWDGFTNAELKVSTKEGNPQDLVSINENKVTGLKAGTTTLILSADQFSPKEFSVTVKDIEDPITPDTGDNNGLEPTTPVPNNPNNNNPSVTKAYKLDLYEDEIKNITFAKNVSLNDKNVLNSNNKVAKTSEATNILTIEALQEGTAIINVQLVEFYNVEIQVNVKSRTDVNIPTDGGNSGITKDPNKNNEYSLVMKQHQTKNINLGVTLNNPEFSQTNISQPGLTSLVESSVNGDILTIITNEYGTVDLTIKTVEHQPIIIHITVEQDAVVKDPSETGNEPGELHKDKEKQGVYNLDMWVGDPAKVFEFGDGINFNDWEFNPGNKAYVQASVKGSKLTIKPVAIGDTQVSLHKVGYIDIVINISVKDKATTKPTGPNLTPDKDGTYILNTYVGITKDITFDESINLSSNVANVNVANNGNNENITYRKDKNVLSVTGKVATNNNPVIITVQYPGYDEITIKVNVQKLDVPTVTVPDNNPGWNNNGNNQYTLNMFKGDSQTISFGLIDLPKKTALTNSDPNVVDARIEGKFALNNLVVIDAKKTGNSIITVKKEGIETVTINVFVTEKQTIKIDDNKSDNNNLTDGVDEFHKKLSIYQGTSDTFNFGTSITSDNLKNTNNTIASIEALGDVVKVNALKTGTTKITITKRGFNDLTIDVTVLPTRNIPDEPIGDIDGSNNHYSMIIDVEDTNKITFPHVDLTNGKISVVDIDQNTKAKHVSYKVDKNNLSVTGLSKGKSKMTINVPGYNEITIDITINQKQMIPEGGGVIPSGDGYNVTMRPNVHQKFDLGNISGLTQKDVVFDSNYVIARLDGNTLDVYTLQTPTDRTTITIKKKGYEDLKINIRILNTPLGKVTMSTNKVDLKVGESQTIEITNWTTLVTGYDLTMNNVRDDQGRRIQTNPYYVVQVQDHGQGKIQLTGMKPGTSELTVSFNGGYSTVKITVTK